MSYLPSIQKGSLVAASADQPREDHQAERLVGWRLGKQGHLRRGARWSQDLKEWQDHLRFR
jgi:hypothetical protein